MDQPVLNLLNNGFLALLTREDFTALQTHLKIAPSVRGTTLYEDGDEIASVYFPLRGMISLVNVTADGDSIEVGTVESEGCVGAMVGVGIRTSSIKAIIQIPGQVAEISAARFRAIASTSTALRDLCIRYNEVQLIQARVSVACNALHSVEQRFCRWLLQSERMVNADSMALTQEFMAQMLGVQRSSVSQVANKMQRLGNISYVRGQIRILNRAGLELAACDCLDSITHKSGRVWPKKT